MSTCALAGCAGGGSGNPPATVGPPGRAAQTAVSFTITFPARAAAHGASRQYVSPSIASLTLAVNGGKPTIVNAPPAATTPATITTVVPAPAGNDVFSIAEYDGPNGAGNVLGSVTQTRAVVLGTLNVLALTVNGELAKIAIQAGPGGFVEGSLASGFTLVGNAPQTFFAVPEDADGNTIVAPGSVPAIAVTSATPAAITATQGTSDSFTLQAPVPTAAVTITAKGANLEGTAVTATFEVAATGAFYIADYTAQAIRVFDEAGTPLALPATAFRGLSNPMGLALVPGTPGSLLVTETSNYQAPFVTSFDPAGNAQTLAASAFGGTSQPLFLTFAANEVFVPNYYTSTLSVFDGAGNAVAQPAGAYPSLAQPVGTAYDPNNQELYVTNAGNDTLTAYATATGQQVGKASTGSHPMGIVFDPNTRTLFVAYGGTFGDALDAPNTESPQVAGVDEFRESLAAVSTTGSFTNTSTSTFFTGITYDPYAKLIYIADAGTSKIDAFTEAGAPATLGAGAFSTFSATASPPGDPMAILFNP